MKNIQTIILKNKKIITIISIILIIIAFVFHYGLKFIEIANYTMLTAGIIGVLPIAIQAYQSLRVKVISIDILVSLAVIGAFVIENYEEAAIVSFLFLFGNILEQRTLTKTRSAIKNLVDMAPESALKLNANGTYDEVMIEDVNTNDILLIKTGAKVPVDGIVINGTGYISQASITGESALVTKTKDSYVYAGTILENGTLQIKTDKVGEDTTFGKIIELVEEAQESKTAAERFIDQFAKWYTPAVLFLGILVGVIIGLVSEDWQNGLNIGVTILVLGCPGALVIGVPVSNVAGIGNGAKHGTLFKGSEVINTLSKIDTFVFDKTGTLTLGNPVVADKVYYQEVNQDILGYISAVEKESDHPLAKAMIDFAGHDIPIFKVTHNYVDKGLGIKATVENHEILMGNLGMMKKANIIVNQRILSDIKKFASLGNTVVIIAIDQIIVGILGIRDQIRPEVKDNLDLLKRLGIKNLIVLSGDNQGTVDKVAKELGFTEAYGYMLPEDKSKFVEKLKKNGRKVAFVGDGVNDSPSLAIADIGIAMGSGTDVAIETSDVVLMNSDFNKLPHALALAKTTVRNMKQNIVIAIMVVLVLLTFLAFPWMNMTIGMLVHEASILVVIINGMRLINYQIKTRNKGEK